MHAWLVQKLKIQLILHWKEIWRLLVEQREYMLERVSKTEILLKTFEKLLK